MTLDPKRQQQRTILVVDDDPAFRTDVHDVLRKAGYNVIEAADAASALKSIQTMGDAIDLMIVDLCLSGNVNGLDIIIAAARRKIPAKIVAASAVYDESYLEMAHDLGADVAIRKPLQTEVAGWSLQTVQSLLGVPSEAPPTERLVVVVDDEDTVRRFVKAILQHAGYQVLEAVDGLTALALIEKIGGALDLLVTDYRMPHLDGVGLVRAVKEKYPSIPVVYMSGYTSGAESALFNDPAMHCAFIPKPFFPKAFLELVNRMVVEK